MTVSEADGEDRSDQYVSLMIVTHLPVSCASPNDKLTSRVVLHRPEARAGLLLYPRSVERYLSPASVWDD